MSEFFSTYKIIGVNNESEARQVIGCLLKLPYISRVDINLTKNLVNILAHSEVMLEELNSLLQASNVTIEKLSTSVVQDNTGLLTRRTITLSLEGMHCRSCELTIERKFKNIAGVCAVTADATRGVARVDCEGELNIRALQSAIAGEGYTIVSRTKLHDKSLTQSTPSDRPSFWQLVGAFIVVLVIGKILSRLGWLSPNVGVFNSSSLVAIFLLGLVAASSSCVAVAGGLLLSSVNVWRERYQNLSYGGKTLPVFLFVIGRVVGYGILGAVIGLLGKSLTPSPFITGLITLLAALYMLMMGLDMIHLAPLWLKRFLPQAPKALGHKVMNADQKSHLAMPFLLGGGTFFLPCGFTQSLQLYALTTGDPVLSGAMLAVFALGTAPALIGLGLVSSSFTGKLGQVFFRLAGAAVVVLGVWNIQNGLTIVGYPLPSLKTWWQSQVRASNDPNVKFDGRRQTMRMIASIDNGYEPARFIVRQGVPVRWEIEAREAGGCIRVLQAPRLGIRNTLLKTNELNVIEFTPREVGNFTFSCSMGMYRGQIVVIPNS